MTDLKKPSDTLFCIRRMESASALFSTWRPTAKKVNSLIYSQTVAVQSLVCTSKSRCMPCFWRPLQLFATLKSTCDKGLNSAWKFSSNHLLLLLILHSRSQRCWWLSVLFIFFCLQGTQTSICTQTNRQFSSAQRPWFWLQKEAGGDK